MAEIEIGLGKSGRRAYGFDDIAIVPSRRTRDPEDVDISWEIDAYRFDLPLMASAMDGVVSPATAIEIGRLGGVGVLNLEGLWTRYEDADAAPIPTDLATAVELARGSDWLKSLMSDEQFEIYCQQSERELEFVAAQVTRVELDRYLGSF